MSRIIKICLLALLFLSPSTSLSLTGAFLAISQIDANYGFNFEIINTSDLANIDSVIITTSEGYFDFWFLGRFQLYPDLGDFNDGIYATSVILTWHDLGPGQTDHSEKNDLDGNTEAVYFSIIIKFSDGERIEDNLNAEMIGQYRVWSGQWSIDEPPGNASVIVAWDPNSEPDLAGYRVYYGRAPRTYNTMIDVGNNTNQIVNDLHHEMIYYFAVTAYDSSGNESSYSDEAIANIPPPQAETPQLKNFIVRSIDLWKRNLLFPSY